MNSEQQQTIHAMRDAGYLVIVWSPKELNGVDVSHIEDVLIERGNDLIEAAQLAGSRYQYDEPETESGEDLAQFYGPSAR
jgi:hypothetical protein